MEEKLINMLQALTLINLRRINRFKEASEDLLVKENSDIKQVLIEGVHQSREFVLELAFMIRLLDGEPPEPGNEELSTGEKVIDAPHSRLQTILKSEDKNLKEYDRLMKVNETVDNDLYNRIRLQRLGIKQHQMKLAALLSE